MSVISSSECMNTVQKQTTNTALLTSYLFPVLSDLEQLEKDLKYSTVTTSAEAKKMIHHVFSGVGKRVRPAIYFLVCKMLNYQGKHKLPVAVAIEYVHTASLLHDDVVDDSKIRRNKATLHSIWGCESAILVGDLIYSTASEILTTTNKLEIVANFARTIRVMSEGELVQLENIFNLSMKLDTYISILQAKTGCLLGTACSSAGILAELTPKACQILSQFGEYLGIAFQLVDDALDFSATTKEFGKTKNKDLLEGRITLPLLLLQNHASVNELNQLTKILLQDKILPEDIEVMKQMVTKYKTSQATINLAKKYTEQALSILTKNFPQSHERQNLERLAQALVQREF